MEQDITRRRFLWKILVLLGGIFSTLVALPIIGFIASPLFQKKKDRWIPVAWLEDLQGTGPQDVSFNYFKQDAWLRSNVKESVYVLRQDGEEFVVMSTQCTHLGCSVHWDPSQKKFLCPCHGGQYDIRGNVVGGPPPKSLGRYNTKIENGRLFIKQA